MTGGFRLACRCLNPIHSSVSTSRSSNRTCGFPASGSRTRRSCLRTSLACSAVCSFWTVGGVDRLTPISRSRATCCAGLELRSLPSTGVTRLRRYYGPLRHPSRLDADPRGPSIGGHAPPAAGASRVALGLLVHTCRRHYPGGAAGPVRSWSPGGISLPLVPKVGLRVSIFEACSAFTRVAARVLARSLDDPSYRRLQPLRCLHDCSDCYRLERQLPGGNCTR